MELPDIKILDEKNKFLRKTSKEVSFPLSKSDQKLIDDSLTYLEMSQIDEYIEKYNLRAGMGLSFVQLGIAKRIFVAAIEEEDGTFTKRVFINPNIISKSEEMIFVGEGEGCLSVNRDVEGIVPRHARVTIKAQNIDGEEFTIRLREDLSVLAQHELDHLNGILFFDHIDKNDPYKNAHMYREI